ncbi:MAG: alpha/beta fold hydrolase [Phycisphaerales bacterium]|nr:alpha/beta fold hydrolase [Phycisphaerales bacterium]
MSGTTETAMQGWLERMNMMPKVMDYARKARKGATEFEVAFESGPVKVRRYRSDVPKQYAPPLLCVFALVNRPYVLDLLPHKSVIRQFLNRGFDVHLVDWGEPTPADSDRTLHDYIEVHLHRIVQHLRLSCDVDQISLMGYCMGGTMCAMYTSLHQELIRNFILMAAPIDWSDRSQLLAVWTDQKYFDVDNLVDTLGNVPPEFLGSSFRLLRPVDTYINKWLGFYERMTDEAFLEEFFAMETWSSDDIPISGEVYRDFVKYGLQQNLLVQGRFPLGEHRIDLRKINCPVLNLTADADHLVPCGQSLPVKDYISSDDYEAMSIRAGHIGLAVGSKAHRELWPRVCDWLAARSDAL